MPLPERAALGAALAAHPKLNLSLDILERRADGLHEIRSLVALAHGIADRVWLEAGDATSNQTYGATRLEGPFAASLDRALDETTADNLTDRAARLGGIEGGVRLVLEKHIPPGSGFGGGTADAVAVLRLLGVEGGASACAELGADFAATQALHRAERGASVWVAGIGERAQASAFLPRTFAVLAWPGISLGAAQVYARAASDARQAGTYQTDASGASVADASEPPPHAGFACAAELAAWSAARGNALGAAACALAPEAGHLRDRLRASEACLHAEISGSGSGCFGLFAEGETAEAAAERLRGDGTPWAHVCTLGADTQRADAPRRGDASVLG